MMQSTQEFAKIFDAHIQKVTGQGKKRKKTSNDDAASRKVWLSQRLVTSVSLRCLQHQIWYNSDARDRKKKLSQVELLETD